MPSRTTVRLHQPGRLEPGQRLAHHAPADAEALHDFGFGRQLVARLERFRGDLLLHEAHDGLREVAGAARRGDACELGGHQSAPESVNASVNAARRVDSL
jgi:hypothetical protein